MTSQSPLAEKGSTPDDIATFVSELTFDELPADSVRVAETCFLDTVGVMAAGSQTEAGTIAAELLDTQNSAGGAPVVEHEKTVSAPDAAFVNGTMAHSLDFDDMAEKVDGHPSAVLVPAILASTGDGKVTGQEAITAFIAGFETIHYLGSMTLPSHLEAGWHPTATLGVFGAVAATANLRNLDELAVRHAINIAASTPAGLKRNIGTMTKPMHAGHAARSGVTATLLAEHGFTAAEDAIDGDRGFIDVYSDAESSPTTPPFTLGEYWASVDDGISIKKFPCCYCTHASMEAAQDIVESEALDPDDIEEIRVRVSQGTLDVLEHEDPETGLQAKFSMHYALAAAIVLDRVDLSTFEDDAIDDKNVQQLRERVELELDEDIEYNSYHTSISVTTRDGARFEASRSHPPGSPENPLTDTELKEKFILCVSRVTDAETAQGIYESLASLRDQSNGTAVLSAL